MTKRAVCLSGQTPAAVMVDIRLGSYIANNQRAKRRQLRKVRVSGGFDHIDAFESVVAAW
ncbi:hypothetical protein DEA98_24305 [Brucella pseudogrignonensis]|nr:hypothetical protein [Brucella pseudogrignonensis]